VKYFGAALLAFVAGLFVGGLFHGPAKAAVAMRDSAHVELAHLDSSQSARQSADSIAVDSVAVLQTRVDRARHTAAVAGQTADSLRDSVLAMVNTHIADSSARAELADLIVRQDSVRRDQVQALGMALVATVNQANLWHARYDAANLAALEGYALVKRNVVRIDSLAAMARGRSRCGLGFAGGYSLTTRGAGPGITVGVSCRV
jgi:hypothetical protein